MRISGGLKEDGIVVGNAYDKYNSKNPIVRKIMAGFDNSLSELVAKSQPTSIHEVGCGEGFWVMRWREKGLNARGSDFSTQAIDIARANATERNLPSSVFEARSIYDIETGRDSADLVVCCEVMEHLEHPEQGLQALQRVVGRHLILSVPREPIWCALNLARGKYIGDFGNTPGHIQHWSQKGFISLVSRYFDILEVKSPLPWTMLLCKPK